MFRRPDYTVNPTIESNYSSLIQNRQLIVDKYSSEINALYMLILKDAESLQNSSEKQDKLKFCKQIQSSCDELIKKINDIIQKIIPLEKDLEKQLIDTEANSNQVNQEINKTTTSKHDLENKQANLATKQKELLNHKRELERDIKEIEKKIQQENFPISPFFVGIIGAFPLLLSDKKGLEDKLAHNQRELDKTQNDLNDVNNDIIKSNIAINALHVASQNLTNLRTVIDKTIKQTAKNLTSLRNFEVSLKEKFNYYKFIVMKDLELIEDQILEEILDPQEISSFIETIKKIQSIKIIELWVENLS